MLIFTRLSLPYTLSNHINYNLYTSNMIDYNEFIYHMNYVEHNNHINHTGYINDMNTI